jgi:hypothetical protein
MLPMEYHLSPLYGSQGKRINIEIIGQRIGNSKMKSF